MGEALLMCADFAAPDWLRSGERERQPAGRRHAKRGQLRNVFGDCDREDAGLRTEGALGEIARGGGAFAER
jgi:hypothetical protein